jgi:hypothetical protein
VTDVTLYATPRWRHVVLAQLRVVGISLRPAGLIVAAALAIGTILIGAEIAGGGPGFDATDTFPTAFVAFLFPFAVWRNEQRFGAALLWTFPVERRRLALAKVFAGFLWLMAGIAMFSVWLLALGLFSHATPVQTIARVPFTATVAMYLFGSALLLGLRHPLRWLLGGGGVLFLMGTLSDLLTQPNDGEWRHVPGAHTFFDATSRAFATWSTLPQAAQWSITAILWWSAGLAALWAAASRHRERRRP